MHCRIKNTQSLRENYRHIYIYMYRKRNQHKRLDVTSGGKIYEWRCMRIKESSRNGKRTAERAESGPRAIFLPFRGTSFSSSRISRALVSLLFFPFAFRARTDVAAPFLFISMSIFSCDPARKKPLLLHSIFMFTDVQCEKSILIGLVVFARI